MTISTAAQSYEVVALVVAITPRYRAAVLLTAWCGLPRGEVLGLHRQTLSRTVRAMAADADSPASRGRVALRAST